MRDQEPIVRGQRTIPGVLLLMVLAVAAALGWRLTQPSTGGNKLGNSQAAPAVTPYARAEISIDGMDCLLCAAGLQNQLRTLQGVAKAEVSYQDKRAVVEFDPARIDRARLERAILGAGFKVAGSPTPQ